jgi:acyl-coenzyme A synthetase/AMP-(fatty) acid ligase
MGEYLRVEHTLDAAAAAQPHQVALVCGARRWTYGELRAERDRRAGVLVEAGLRVGDRLVTAERVSDEYVVTLFACAQAGVTHAGLSPLLTSGEQAALTARLAPRLALTATGAPHPGLPGAPNLPLALPGTPGAAAIAEAARRSAAGTADDPVMIRHSSGTTGQAPKLVLRPHRQLTCMCGHRPWPAGEGSIYSVPMTAVLNAPEICRTFALAATFVVPQETRINALEAELAAHGVTVVLASPALFGALSRQSQPPPPALRLETVRTFGAALAPEVRQAVEARYRAPVLEEYGTGECSAILRSPGPDTPAGSVGKPYPGVTVRLLDSAGDEVPAGAVGELVVRSPGVMLSYVDDPEATAAALHDGWLHTGDGARRDADGYYFLAGRRGLLINVAGHKVAPEEVEVVLDSHPGVREAVVVPQPDALRGEVVKAIVVPEGAAPDAQALRRYCRARLAGYKVPRSISFRETPLPRSALGKVLRQQL